MSRPAAVLFDLDDTLYPERSFVDGGFRAVAAFLAGVARRARSGAPPDAALVERLWELHRRDGRGQLFDTILGELGLDGEEDGKEDRAEDFVAACVLLYRTHPPTLTPFAGIVALLDVLRSNGIRTGVVTDGNAAVQSRKLAALAGIAERVDTAVFTDLLGPGRAKPSPVPFRVACRLLGVSPRDTIYVGNDPRKDFAGARAAGLATIRFGAVPDEGGPAGQPIASTGPIADADRAAASIEALTTLLLGTTT